MTEFPEIGTPIAVRDPEGHSYASRVEDIDGARIAVARPLDLLAGSEYPEGLELELVWHLPSGVHVLPAELVGTSTVQQVRLWELEVVGDGWIQQRREYVRVDVSGRVELTVVALPDDDGGTSAGAGNAPDARRGSATDESPDAVIRAELIDISEVAMQCAVPASPDDRPISVGSALRCRFTLGSATFDVPGSVAIVRDGRSTAEARVVVKFDGDSTTGDALRKEIFAVQLARRRSAQA